MKIVLFVHSLRSCWNHGNAHFVRGVASELVHRGHDVVAWEPEGAWSAENLVRDHGRAALDAWRAAYPELAGRVRVYAPGALDPAEALDGADVALVHEWNEPAVVAALGAERARRPSLRLLFHDTHHRAATQPTEMARYELSRYDGVLAFGAVLRDLYLERALGAARASRGTRPPTSGASGRARRRRRATSSAWGTGATRSGARSCASSSSRPVRARSGSPRAYGVRYPGTRRGPPSQTPGIDYGGVVANSRRREAFSRHRVTVHVPRRPYARALPGIPTIRPFEALACGIPLVCAPWGDARACSARPDYLVGARGAEMRRRLRALLAEPGLARALADEAARVDPAPATPAGTAPTSGCEESSGGIG